jgi:hypothetical protein
MLTRQTHATHQTRPPGKLITIRTCRRPTNRKDGTSAETPVGT